VSACGANGYQHGGIGRLTWQHWQVQKCEFGNPDASIRSVSPQVKLLPRGTLRCGPDCTAPSPPGESSVAVGSAAAPRDDFFMRSSRPSQHRTSGSAAVLQAPVSPQPGTGHGYGKAVESATGKQPEPVYDDDEDFGDFVQA
jgi:hypothetical protein